MFRAKFDEKNKIWQSDEFSPVFNPNISIGHIILRSLKLNGLRIAQISDDTGERLTFAEIHKMLIRAAQNLQKRGFVTKQVFGIVAENVSHLAPVVFATMCLGCPMNVLNASMGRPNIIRMLRMTKPGAIFCHVNAYDLFKECLDELDMNLKVFTFNGVKGESIAVEELFEATGIEENFIPVAVDGLNETVAIMNSSGTTGECKGICLSHGNLIRQASNYEMTNLSDISFSPGPLYWMAGFLFLITNTINGATRIITAETNSPQLHLRIVQDYRVTHTFSSPLFINELLQSDLLTKFDLSSVRFWFTGGYKIPFSVLKEFDSYLPNGTVNRSYGSTETGMLTIDYPHCSNMDTIGRIVNGLKVKIIDDNDKKCGIDEDGEICVILPEKFLGYFGNEQLSKEVIDEEGYFHTGDVCRIDKHGNVYILDRKKDIIFHNTNRIFPADVEAVLQKSPEIKNICVVGVRVSCNERLDQELPAAVVVRANASKITEEDIRKIAEDELATFGNLCGGVYFVDSIPKTVSGKLIRREAKAIATKLYHARQ